MPKGKNLFIMTSVTRWEANGGCCSSQEYWHTGARPVQGHRAARRLEHMMYTGRWRERGLFSREKRRKTGDLPASCSYLSRGSWEGEGRPFSDLHGNRMRDTGRRAESGQFHLETWRNTLLGGRIKLWNSFPERLRDLHLWRCSRLKWQLTAGALLNLSCPVILTTL